MGSSLLILGAVLYAAQWKWHFWQVSQNNPSIVANTVDGTQKAEQNEEFANPDNNSIREVLSANLFGTEGVAKNASAEAVPKTAQPLELRGIVFIPHHPEQSVALIAHAGQLAKDYKKGDEVSAGITVAEILPNLVFLENQGAREKLELPKPDFSQTGNQQPAISSANQFDNLQTQEGVDPAAENVAPPPGNEPFAENMPSPQGNNPQPVNAPAENAPPIDNIQPPPASPVDNPMDNYQ